MRASRISLFLAWVCAASASLAAAQTEVVRLGFASPLTGPQAHYGEDNLRGARMAIEELNAASPRIGSKAVRFELLAEDDQADPRTGTLVAQRLVDAGIRGMIRHFNSAVTLPASRIYHEAGIRSCRFPPTSSTPGRVTERAFRMMADDDKQGGALGRHAVARLGLKRLAVRGSSA